jgi:nucleolar protein 56
MLPASTIQILGAEKALFRYKKEGGKPPKHGVIFQHPLLNRAPRDQRGRIARLLASKITIAIKADVFTKRDIADELNAQLEQQLQIIRKKT